MLPLHGASAGPSSSMAGHGQVFEYMARVLDHSQMDLQATYYQMVTLVTKPADAFKSAYYRKRTKNQWARDDPAFVVVQAALLLAATLAWAVVLRVPFGVLSLLGLLAESNLRLAALFRRQNQPEVAVPVLVEVVKLMTPSQSQGQKAYQSLVELGFVTTEFKGAAPGGGN